MINYLKFNFLSYLLNFLFLFPFLSLFGTNNDPTSPYSVNLLTGQYQESRPLLLLSGPRPTALTLTLLDSKDSNRKGDLGFGWKIEYHTEEGKEGSSHKIQVIPHYSVLEKLEYLEVANPEKKIVFGWVKIQYLNDKITLETHQGGQAEIRYLPMLKGSILKVISEENRETLYFYDEERLVKRIDPSGSYLVNEYENGRIVSQKAPLGAEMSEITVARYSYDANSVTYFNALNHPTLYRFNDKKQVEAIEYYLDNQIYRIEEFSWNENALLTSRRLLDGSKNRVSCQEYLYDDEGHLLRKTMRGNLTGSGEDESYSTNYSYDKEGHLVEEREDNGKRVLYIYDEKGQPRGKLVGEKENNLIRYGFLYDEVGLLSESFRDNGAASDLQNSYDVSEKESIQYTYDLKGFPIAMQEVGYDGKVLKTIRNSYSSKGQLTLQEYVDGEGITRKMVTYHYNEQGKLNFLEDNFGNSTTFGYNNVGDISWEYHSKEQKEKTFEYDLARRRILQREEFQNGSVIETKTVYDALNNKIKTIDLYGNETSYNYDSLGRLIAMGFPESEGCEGRVVKSKLEFGYDMKDRLIISKDANGYVTHTKYNARDQVIETKYPDGTSVTNEYTLDGKLKKTTSKIGITTHYERDLFDRVIKSETFSACDAYLSTTTSTFSAFHETMRKDTMGRVTSFEYSGNGKLTSITKNVEEGPLRQEFSYDSWGLIYTTKSWYGQNPNSYSLYITDRNLEGQIVRSQVRDSQGKTLLNDPKKLKNSHNKRHKESETRNALHQRVREVIDTDEEGVLTITTYDANGRIKKVFKKDDFGKVLKEEEMSYDAAGNKILQNEIAHSHEGPRRIYTISWTYGPLNRVESITEKGSLNGKTLSRSTQYFYNHLGQIEKIQKPNGVIYQEYDEKGHLKAQYDDERTFDYTYAYDLEDRIYSVTDRKNNEVITRHYNSLGKMTMEDFHDHGAVHSQYDLQGRRTHLLLPDHSKVEYIYDAAFLRLIKRCAPDGTVKYSQENTTFDFEGHLLQSSLAGNVGSMQLTWNSEGHKVGITTDHLTQTIDRTSTKNQPLKISTQDPIGKTVCYFSFDSLGQLTEENGDSKNTYAYDTLYNRLKKNDENYSVNGLNQIETFQDKLLSYDLNGNLKQMKTSEKTIHYKYDTLDRLTEVFIENEVRVNYVYDGLNRRLSKSVSKWSAKNKAWTNAQTIRFLYDGEDEIGTLDQDLNLNELFVSPFAIEIKNKAYVPLFDLRHNISSLVDIKRGDVEEVYRTSCFGEETIYNSHGDVITREACINPWRFCGKRVDEETGLVFFGKRTYFPELGRWTSPDPLGPLDTSNLYHFVRNDPLTKHDPYGFFTVSDLWNQFCNSLDQVGTSVQNRIYQHLYNMAHYDPMPDIHKGMEVVGHTLVGPLLFKISGYFSEMPHVGVYGHGELHNFRRITFINGILTSREDLIENLEMISKAHKGANVHYAYRATEGWIRDIINCTFIRMGFVTSDARKLTETWRKLIEDMGGIGKGGTIIHYAHSIGASETLTAKRYLTPDEMRMIRVITFGSPTLIADGGFQNVINLVSVRDGVCYLDPFHYTLALLGLQKNVLFYGSFSDGIPIIDHIFTSYWNEWANHHLKRYLPDLL